MQTGTAIFQYGIHCNIRTITYIYALFISQLIRVLFAICRSISEYMQIVFRTEMREGKKTTVFLIIRNPEKISFSRIRIVRSVQIMRDIIIVCQIL